MHAVPYYIGVEKASDDRLLDDGRRALGYRSCYPYMYLAQVYIGVYYNFYLIINYGSM